MEGAISSLKPLESDERNYRGLITCRQAVGWKIARQRGEGQGFLYIASPQHGDLSGPPSGQGAGCGARTSRQRDPCRSQGGLASHCATDTLRWTKMEHKL
ncbi:hypothetical protein PoB_002877800 [Plakobranchus ocellatus]|uniref:Uncharacterized protein n=1 Tax=Plakobranchus ocellatus TaxID=259542 RepID=A0AAV4A4Z3_9GAST|nr:hypothetical protein PoB_002877800 [Plakobranchus ocellatus]